MPTPFLRKTKKIIEAIIFGSRWFLTIFYMGLILTMFAYTFVFCKEIFEMVRNIGALDKNVILMTVLEIVDIVMIANLIKMIITGSYNSFVDKSHTAEGEKVSSGMLKVKMAMSIIGVSSIHLLQSFIYADKTNWDVLGKQLAIHGIFLIGYVIMAWGNYLHEKMEVEEEKLEHTKLHKEHKPEHNGHQKPSLLTDSGMGGILHHK